MGKRLRPSHLQQPQRGWLEELTISIHPNSHTNMRSLLLSNPNLSTPVPHQLSYQNIKKATPSSIFRRPYIPRCSADTPYGGNVPTFPRVNVWDPYKRLGISPYASEEEIWGSRNFLLQQYAGHERSEESIEAAFEKLLMTSFKRRKKTKINLKSRLKKKVEESPPWIKNLLDFVELPPMDIIFRRLFLFAFMGGWSIMNSAEGGPAFQVAVSLAACIYFLNEKTKSLARASIIGFGALAGGWICGSIVVPMIPTVLIHPAWTLELLTSLVAYIFLFLACTFLNGDPMVPKVKVISYSSTVTRTTCQRAFRSIDELWTPAI